ncbi:MAG: 3-deoxy-D-manno-octulosonic acid transferase [Lewinellaceae bacterium]|nr:3-deoxy-D-manno-octulosonic acid transferase [Lewinellaceae bacterium]
MRILYTFFIGLYLGAIHLAATWSPKARAWVAGRRTWHVNLQEALQGRANRPLLWIHCASLGEFEQGRPVLEALKQERPEFFILLTFFSPSGYEVRKNYPLADAVQYLPADLPGRVKRWVALVNPTTVVFVKYEFWYNLLAELRRHAIPTYLVSAIFRPSQPFFQPYGSWFRRQLLHYRHLFVQGVDDAALLQQIGVRDLTVAGDTRIDRVMRIAEEGQRITALEAFAGADQLLIVGSSWEPDERLLAAWVASGGLPAGWKMVIAPHEIKEDKMQDLIVHFAEPVLRFSQLDGTSIVPCRVLLIDNVGMLAALYRYGKVAYIGGGFGVGIHNILEPIAFGLPVIFGPRYQKFAEARMLIQQGGAFSIANTEEFAQVFQRLLDAQSYDQAQQASQDYLRKNQGATQLIVERILQDIPG